MVTTVFKGESDKSQKVEKTSIQLPPVDCPPRKKGLAGGICNDVLARLLIQDGR
jgi:hypothetical protein